MEAVVNEPVNEEDILYSVIYEGVNLTAPCGWFLGEVYNKSTNITLFDIPPVCKIKYPLGVQILIGFILCVMSIGTTLGNFLVILAVKLVKKLQTPSNLLIVSLACSDFFVSLLVMPLALLQQVIGYWPFDETLCDIFNCCDVLLCTSSILNLCAISIDRYLVITKPLQYAVKRTPLRMCIMIGLAWFASGLISIPPIFGWKEGYKRGQCSLSDNLGYQIYATFGAFYIPLIVMLCLYGHIFKLARDMAQADAKQKLTSPTIMTNKDHTYDPESLQTPLTATTGSVHFVNQDSGGGGGKIRFADDDNQQNGLLPKTNHKHAAAAKPQNKSNSDTKAIKTLGVIMGCFTLCWLPFFIVQLMQPILKVLKMDTVIMIPGWMFELFLWLGYLNSFLNPVIYAKFNREFRTPFKIILMCHCASINARLRSESFAEQYGLDVKAMKDANSAKTRRRNPDVFVNVSKRARLKASVANGNNLGALTGPSCAAPSGADT